ncbi:DUF4129 domain-containing protein [Nocardia terpenica]|nr:DUF4129 domain-containing protein [Nocardia terpenica]
MGRVGMAIPRAMLPPRHPGMFLAGIALLLLAVVALRGFVPGAGGPHAVSPPSVVTVALMPVLSLVSVVILLAGVMTSHHRLPLAMPDREPKRARSAGLSGRALLLVLAVLAATALVAAFVWVVYLLAGHGASPAETPPAATTTARPTEIPLPTPLPAAPELSGRTLLLVGGAAVALVATAMIGLVVVALGTRRAPVPEPDPAAPAAAEPPVSLAEVAEMGLAAMMASGRDARLAVISCYIAMERGLAQAREVAPLASDTPSEVLARAFERGALHDASARELVALFEEARFSPHAMLEWQRMRAEQLLRIVLKDLRGERL